MAVGQLCDVTHSEVSILYPNAGANKVISGFFCNHLLKNLIQTFAGSAMGSAYHGTVTQKRETAILKILKTCGSEWTAKLVDVECFADIIESWFSLGWEVLLTHLS